ncbi:MAG: hypothetical protein AUH78_03245 [Gemmatimonadetes bacterium 13_1_40CM_4_69_8]|nr:MAG: hypothetical protein AUH78_03245 [Gemmatimonadetes bacterium 13_1_40CM_4_69_8]
MNASPQQGRALLYLATIFAIASCDRTDTPAAPVRGPAPALADLQGAFGSTGAMAAARSSHVAVRLDDGRVLVAGGINAMTRLATAELFDPGTGAWSSVANMNFPRLGHAAVLLGNGSVLVIGGARFNNCVEPAVGGSAEIFDPVAGTWTLTGPLNVPRNSPAAVVLQDGRVLVAGGGDRCGHMWTSAELFDPTSGTWTSTGTLSMGRQAPAAALLPDGRVLLAGGTSAYPFPSLASAELYDPATGTWSATGSMADQRIWTSEDVSAAGFLVVLPDGKVLTAGGVSRPDNFGASDTYLKSAELYAPATGTWSPAGDMLTPRSEHQLTPLTTGQVLATGGRFSGALLDGAEVFDPGTGMFSDAGTMASARFDHTATRLTDGRVLLAGGLAIGGLSSAEIFAFSTSTNRAPVAVAGAGVTALEGAIVSFDGSASSDPDGDALTFTWDFGDGSAGETGPAPSHTYVDNGSYTVTLTVSDGNLTNAASTAATITNVPPAVGPITAPVDPVEVGTPVTASATFTDPGLLDTHTASIDWGDGTSSSGLVSEVDGSGSVDGTHSYLVAGVYKVTLTVADKDGGIGQAVFEFVIAFDPIVGFVTGGGWIDSPPGAYAADPTLTGKANFGFVARYQPGATVPSGQTEFRFQVAGLNFHSTVYDWLVVSGTRAQFKGSGTVNGSDGFRFMISAVDGDLNAGRPTDGFRIRIWDETSGGVIYDNQMDASDRSSATTALGGGSIVIHR